MPSAPWPTTIQLDSFARGEYDFEAWFTGGAPTPQPPIPAVNASSGLKVYANWYRLGWDHAAADQVALGADPAAVKRSP